MITIDLLKNHPYAIPRLAEIWQEVLGSIWIPDVPMERVQQTYKNHLNTEAMPLTIVALDGDKPVGMCSLRDNDGIRPDLTPWLGSLVVDPAYQNRKIGRQLIDAIKAKAIEFDFKKLHLFALDPTIPDYYERLGWTEIAKDQFKIHPVTVMEIDLA
ncbi:MAG: GNAT family N-acetyltransferase [Legionella sp.]|nr:MAG: GNAT family N-acetyltransferase [Legionella sp.]